MKIYVNSEFRCFASPDDGLTPVETSVFNGKCTAFIEGYRFVPEGETWTRDDGEVFHGEMISPITSYEELAAAQAQYEIDMADLEAAYREGVNSI